MKRTTIALIDESRCIGCTRCIEACPVDAIVGAHQLMHTVVEPWCIGCALCHTPTLTTGLSPFTGMSNFTYSPFSDFALHHMGDLRDGVTQGAAGPDQFRTAPLWGLGQRLYFLHDGRTSNLVEAIEAHRSQHSEANKVIDRFNRLPARERQDAINFLRSL